MDAHAAHLRPGHLRGRATSPPRIIPRYARPGPGRALGQRQGSGQPRRRRTCSARSEPYELRPFFFSDQYDLGCEYRGLADPAGTGWSSAAISQPREFTAFWLRDGAVAAAMNVNQWDDGDALQELVDSGRPVEVDQLVSGSLS